MVTGDGVLVSGTGPEDLKNVLDTTRGRLKSFAAACQNPMATLFRSDSPATSEKKCEYLFIITAGTWGNDGSKLLRPEGGGKNPLFGDPANETLEEIGLMSQEEANIVFNDALLTALKRDFVNSDPRIQRLEAGVEKDRQVDTKNLTRQDQLELAGSISDKENILRRNRNARTTLFEQLPIYILSVPELKRQLCMIKEISEASPGKVVFPHAHGQGEVGVAITKTIWNSTHEVVFKALNDTEGRTGERPFDKDVKYKEVRKTIDEDHEKTGISSTLIHAILSDALRLVDNADPTSIVGKNKSPVADAMLKACATIRNHWHSIRSKGMEHFMPKDAFGGFRNALQQLYRNTPKHQKVATSIAHTMLFHGTDQLFFITLLRQTVKRLFYKHPVQKGRSSTAGGSSLVMYIMALFLPKEFGKDFFQIPHWDATYFGEMSAFDAVALSRSLRTESEDRAASSMEGVANERQQESGGVKLKDAGDPLLAARSSL